MEICAMVFHLWFVHNDKLIKSYSMIPDFGKKKKEGKFWLLGRQLYHQRE